MAKSNISPFQNDLLGMNFSWNEEELKLYENSSNPLMSAITIFLSITTLILAFIVQKAFYQFMKRLPDRIINSVIYPHMVLFLITIMLP